MNTNSNEYFNYLNSFNTEPLEDEELQKLIKKAKKGDTDAMNSICLHNIGLIMMVLKSYTNISINRLEKTDLMQAGFLGLINAVKHYNEKKNTKFSTCAVIWIRQSILRTIQNESSQIYIPLYYQQALYNVNLATKDYLNEYHKSPTDEELFDYIKQHNYNFGKYKVNTVETINEIRNIGNINNIEDLDKNVKVDGDDDNLSILNTIADKNLTPEERVLKEDFYNTIINSVNNLDVSDKNKKIFLQYYGLDKNSNDNISLTTIGEQYHMTRERVRQICNYVLDKLKEDVDLMDYDINILT